MRVIAIHHMSDPTTAREVWQHRRLPPREHFQVLMTVPARDYAKAVCVWEAPSVSELQQYLDEGLADVCRNELHETDPAGVTVGLPPVDDGS
jgi:hypothetical protein